MTKKRKNQSIKYYLKAKQIKKPDLDDIIEDLFFIENVLTKEDCLIIVTEDDYDYRTSTIISQFNDVHIVVRENFHGLFSVHVHAKVRC